MFFSHTIKAQAANLPLLDALLAQRVRMVDYECITEGGIRGGHRLVAFGKFAGIAGAIDFCRGLGERFLSMGYSTPFLAIGAAYMYPDAHAALEAIATCGRAIAQYGLPADLCPLTVVFTGRGNVSAGAQDVWRQLPLKWVHPFELKNIVHTAAGADKTNVIYAAVATQEHMVRKRRGAPTSSNMGSPSSRGGAASPLDAVGFGYSAAASDAPTPLAAATPTTVAADAVDVEADDAESFDKADYARHPAAYEPIFHVKVAPYTSVLINCMYWEPRFPRLLTVHQAQELKRQGRLRLVGVCDITCDFQGSIEFLKVRGCCVFLRLVSASCVGASAACTCIARAASVPNTHLVITRALLRTNAPRVQEFTSIEKPFYVYDVALDRVEHDMDAPGVLYHAVDHLPSELPRDASEHFGKCLTPLIPELARSDGARPFADQELRPELKGAVITAHGQLTPSTCAAVRVALPHPRARFSWHQPSEVQRQPTFCSLLWPRSLESRATCRLPVHRLPARGISACERGPRAAPLPHRVVHDAEHGGPPV
jgi:alpha-aminoadipic semialdehyde synthase